MKKSFVYLAVASCLTVATLPAMACGGAACPTVENHFKKMDLNHDGAISKAEFDAEHGKRFKALDANHDGKISLEEMQAAHDKLHDDKPGHPMGAFKTRFDEADANHDGALSKAEAATMPMLSEHFDEFDGNKDGQLTHEEIRSIMREMHPRPPAVMPPAAN